jgi:hypothetical protein
VGEAVGEFWAQAVCAHAAKQRQPAIRESLAIGIQLAQTSSWLQQELSATMIRYCFE